MRRLTKRSVFSFLIVSIVIFFLGHRVVSRKPDIIDQGASCLLYPVLLAQQKIVIPLKDFMERKNTIQELEERLAVMQQALDDVQAQNTELIASKHFAEQTHELINFKKRYATDTVHLVQVLVRRLSEQEQTLLVDAGARHGVVPDMVAVHKNNIVGRVTQVFPFYSKVALVTDRTCKIAARCAASGATGIYEGNNQTVSAALHHVSHLTSLQQDDLVLSSGQGLVFPEGFALGRIASFEKAGLHQCVTVQPLIDPRQLSYCYLIKRGGEDIHTRMS